MRADKDSTFIDTSYVVALFSPRDNYYGRAVHATEAIRQTGARLVTTEAILVEIGNAMARMSTRALGVQIIRNLQESSDIEIVAVDSPLLERGIALYAKRTDKEWGLTDCISFIVMQQHGIMRALTTDHHFEQAGFQVLL